ncbi:MAG: hypothetical protein RL410_206 [Actinomycetota bacterium]|jgi:phosphatidylinositol alpha-mannosyltransferase
MKVGIVCPYDWSVPGGVQAHIHDLALELMSRGYEVNVLAPTSGDDVLPSWVTSGGKPLALSYNGSVARITFSVRAAARVRRWISAHKFDVLHVHEPLSPSLSALACWAARGPVVGTFHSSMDRSRVLAAGYGLAQTALENIVGRIAVSELARTTVVEHVGGDPVLIPNGVHVNTLARVQPMGGSRKAQQICFLGRFEEPRKGFSILLEAFRTIADEFPQATLVVAGPGNPESVLDKDDDAQRITFLGRVSDSDKAAMLAASEIYVAPNTGGESFGIVLLEAMACHTPVIASNLAAFNRVLDYGQAGLSFENENAEDLARALRELLSNEAQRNTLSEVGFARVQKFDWGRVAGDIINVYETVTAMSGPVEEDLRGQIVGRLARES